MVARTSEKSPLFSVWVNDVKINVFRYNPQMLRKFEAKVRKMDMVQEGL